MKQPNDELIALALAVVDVLDKRCKQDCYKPPWQDFHNKNGADVGLDVEWLIKKAKRILQKHVP